MQKESIHELSRHIQLVISMRDQTEKEILGCKRDMIRCKDRPQAMFILREQLGFYERTEKSLNKRLVALLHKKHCMVTGKIDFLPGKPSLPEI